MMRHHPLLLLPCPLQLLLLLDSSLGLPPSRASQSRPLVHLQSPRSADSHPTTSDRMSLHCCPAPLSSSPTPSTTFSPRPKQRYRRRYRLAESQGHEDLTGKASRWLAPSWSEQGDDAWNDSIFSVNEPIELALIIGILQIWSWFLRKKQHTQHLAGRLTSPMNFSIKGKRPSFGWRLAWF